MERSIKTATVNFIAVIGINYSMNVKAMSDAVSASRGKKRIRKEQDAEIKECKDEASLMEYFLAF